MEYLKRILNIDAHVVKSDIMHKMPKFISNRYNIEKVRLNNIYAFFAYPRNALDTIDSVQKHIRCIQKEEMLPVVLILEKLTAYQKDYLLKANLPFIVDERQIYLPFMAIYLQARNDADSFTTDTLLPSAQVLLLYFIYGGYQCLRIGDAVKALGFTATSISRAVRQLEDFNLVTVKKEGVQKSIMADCSPKELFEKAGPYFRNPVKRTVFISSSKKDATLLFCGYSALSNCSMLGSPRIQYFASSEITKWTAIATKHLESTSSQSALELWHYDPRKLSASEQVDTLSLALSLRDDHDERVEEAVEDMLEEFWREHNGWRN